MPGDDISIANEAIVYLGAPPITDFAEDNDVARIARTFYESCRDYLLGCGQPWGFATVRQVLARREDAPTFGFTYAYGYPTDPACLRALDTNADESWLCDPTWPWAWPVSGLWRIERLDVGGDPADPNAATVIVSDESALSLRYVARITDPTRYSPGFRTALVARLRAEMSYPLTQKGDMTTPLAQAAGFALAQAKAWDTKERRGPVRPARDLINVRYR